jgi:carbonic anhydrase
MAKALYIAAACLLFLNCVSARSWRDIELHHDLNPGDVSGKFHLYGKEHLYKAEAFPGYVPPTLSPTLFPSDAPSSSPTNAPTGSPSLSPSESPSGSPSDAPTPLPDPYPSNPTPQNANPWYFNYDTSDDSRYGPGELALVQERGSVNVKIRNNRWGTVASPPNDYWEEFDEPGFGPWQKILASQDPTKNVCESGLQQSPIDIRENGAKCEEHHEVRSLPGDFQVTGDRVIKQIHGNKLRLVYERRPCADLDEVECQEPDPPHADFPNGWGGFADVMHIDFKIPSEHLIWGERFDAEMQIFHLHPGRRRMPAQSVLIRATKDGYNDYFQQAIKAFAREYVDDMTKCAEQLKRERNLVAQVHEILGPNVTRPFVDYRTWAEFSTEIDRPGYQEERERESRRLQFRGGVWDPHHEMLIPTIHFYRYDGSLTEPPCGEFVSWFVADKPMIISFEQLDDLKKLIFTHVNANCRKTSVHFDQSVARPIRKSNNRPVWKCTPDDFGPDP